MNTLQPNFNRIWIIFIDENAFGNVVSKISAILSGLQYVTIDISDRITHKLFRHGEIEAL